MSKTQHRHSQRPVTGQESVHDMQHTRTDLGPQGGEQELAERRVNAMKKKKGDKWWSNISSGAQLY